MGKMIIFDQGKNLSFIDVPGKGKGVKDSVCIRTKGLSIFIFTMLFLPAPQGGM